MTERLDKYDFNQAGVTTYTFFWDEFADWFIEVPLGPTGGREVPRLG